ncbi:MAG: hypothetical protein LLG04_11480 [Parachlamydia sp.]|nr:hypothetical protein [Parachlamydia sp.]
MIIFRLILVFFTFCRPLGAQEVRHDDVFLEFRMPHEGIFATFSALVCMLIYYESGQCAGLEVDFQKYGIYYDADHGPNWWEYYCEPISLGNKRDARILPCSNCLVHEIFPKIEELLTLPRILEVIQKHIKIKSHIRRKADFFAEHNFKGFHIIGVHYRGTDRVTDASRVPYEEVVDKVQNYIEECHLVNYRIFVATDEQPFLDLMQTIFPKRILAIPAARSTDRKAVHIGSKTPYLQGEEAMIDCLLLSRSSVLFRCSSWLSTWASAFNPAMPVIMLQGKSRDDWEKFRN